MEDRQMKRPALIVAATDMLPPPEYLLEVNRKAQVILVLDGMETDTQMLEQAGLRVVRHWTALGLGRAVKSGLNELLNDFPGCTGALIASTARPLPLSLIDAMAGALERHPMSLSLGIAPVTEQTPRRQAKERIWAARLFSVINGTKLSDIRPALRAVPASLLGHYAVSPGEGEDYLLNMIIRARGENIPLQQVPLPACDVRAAAMRWTDWMRMLAVLLGFLASSLTSFLIDYGVFTLLYLWVSKSVTLCTVGARAVSSLVNYGINRRVVFKSKNPGLGTLARYYALVISLMLVNIGLIKLFSTLLSIPVLMTKPLVEAGVYALSFWMQRDVVFKKKTAR